MRLAITGAGGFVGQAVVHHLKRHHRDVQLLLADRTFDTQQGHPTITGDLGDPAIIRELTDDRVDAMLHLAALPGGVSERDPSASRAINVDVPLNLIQAMQWRRLVIAGSIAVFGGDLTGQVDDDSPPAPTSVYGAHKRMIEIAFADAMRRGAIGGMVLRLPGIVARPRGAGGFGSAFLSDILHAAKLGAAYCVPVAPDATSWLLSSQVCAANLVDAALGSANEGEAVTLPALRVQISDLAEELARQGYAPRLSFKEDTVTRAMFGRYPTIVTHRADMLGLQHDGTLCQLVANVMADI